MEQLAQLCIALVLGMLLGLERSVAHKTAGLRTYGLVSLGSCLLCEAYLTACIVLIWQSAI